MDEMNRWIRLTVLLLVMLLCPDNASSQTECIDCKQGCSSVIAKKEYCCNSVTGKCCNEYKHSYPTCRRDKVEYFPHKCSCRAFIRCRAPKMTIHFCPLGGGFNATSQSCSHILNSTKFCGKRHHYSYSIPVKYIKITFIIQDHTTSPKPPPVQFSGIVFRQPLINIMIELAAFRKDFRFTINNHKLVWRYITCINRMCNTKERKWRITYMSELLKLGRVNSIVPNHGSIVKFDLVSKTGGK